MLKKQLSLFSLFVACTLLLVHSIIPHHHHHTYHELKEHNHTGHNNHSHDNGHDTNHLFSHLVHSDNDFTTTGIHNISNSISKRVITLIAILPEIFSITNYFAELPAGKPPDISGIYFPSHSLAAGLRAPPSF